MRVKVVLTAMLVCLASVFAVPAASAAPSSAPPHPAGVAVWHDSNGWHVRVTHTHSRTMSSRARCSRARR